MRRPDWCTCGHHERRHHSELTAGACTVCTCHAFVASTDGAGARRYLPERGGRTFQCFWNFLGWTNWSLGVHVGVDGPHVDVHLPGGFARLGWVVQRVNTRVHCYGWQGRPR